MKNLTSQNVLIGFTITVGILFINIFTGYQNIARISENNRVEFRSDESIDVLMNIQLALKDIEIGQREYWLTNNPYYLRSNRLHIDRIERELNCFKQLKSDRSPAVQQYLTKFITDLQEQLTNLNQNIDRRQVRPLTPDLQILLSREGQSTITIIQKTVAELEQTEQISLDRDRIESRRSLAFTQLSFNISGLLDLLLVLILYRLVNLDLIKREQVESTLREYAAEFEELYHNAPCGYHSLDSSAKFVRINRTELQMLGYTAAELIRVKSFRDLLTPDSVKTFDEYFPLVKSRGWIRDVEFNIIRKDGQILPVSASVVAIKDRHGNYLTSRSTLIDISDRVRLREQAKLSAEISQKIRQSLNLDEILGTAVIEVQKLLEVDRVLISRVEPDGRNLIVKEQVIGGYLPAIDSPEIDPCFNRSYHAKYAQGQIYSIPDLTQAGLTPCYLEFLEKFAVKAYILVPIFLRDKLWGLLIIHHCRSSRDWLPSEIALLNQLANQIGIALTQSQLLEQEHQQRQELIRSNAELEQFAYIASHDLQEPLRMVTSYLQLLERRYQGKLDRDADEFIGYAVDGAARMQVLIKALLSYARVSSRQQTFTLVNCNLVLKNALDNLQVAICESGAIITSDLLPEVHGDETQLTQLFQNLIANGIKFCRDSRPKIQISVQSVDLTTKSTIDLSQSSLQEFTRPTTAWQFSIADNGIGIEPEYVEQIFAIFQRLHSRATYPGVGIGLAICKKIIERHGGQIWVESQRQTSSESISDRGSVFYFIIPDIAAVSSQHSAVSFQTLV